MLVKEGDICIIKKLSDDVFDGKHPNNIYEGYCVVGILQEDVKVGERCNVQGNYFNDYLHTSIVIEIIDETTFKTQNSTYSLTLKPE